MAVIGEIAVNVVALTDGLKRGLNAASAEMNKFKLGAGVSLGGVGAAFGVAAAAAGAAAYAFKKTVDSIDDMNEAASRMNATYNGLASLQYVAKLSGTEFEALQTSLGNMNARLGEVSATGEGPAAEALKRLGLDARTLVNMKAEDAFQEIAGKLVGIQNASERAATAMDIFGKSGKEIINTVNLGASGIERLRKEAETLGYTLKEKTIKNVSEFSDQWDRAKGKVANSPKAVTNSEWWNNWVTEPSVGALQSFNDVNNPNNRAWWDPTKWFSQTGTEAPAISPAERAAFKPRHFAPGESWKTGDKMFEAASKGMVDMLRKADSAISNGSLASKIGQGTDWLEKTQRRMEMKQAAVDYYNDKIAQARSGGAAVVGLNRAVDARTGEGVAYAAQLRKEAETRKLMEDQIHKLEEIRDAIIENRAEPEIRAIP